MKVVERYELKSQVNTQDIVYNMATTVNTVIWYI